MLYPIGLCFLCLVLLQVAHGLQPDIIKNVKLTNMKKLAAFGVLSFSLTTQNLQYDPSTFALAPASVAQADSTGKFSTKLTARKRYLPRINTGVTEFKALTQTKAPNAGVATFVDTTLPNLERAMSLYGASLRKGETPDDISRNADRLTQVFVKQAGELGVAVKDPSKYSAQLAKTTTALEEYLKFAGLPSLSSADYNPK